MERHIFNALKFIFMSKILVTGGTGLVGSHLLYFLTKQELCPIAIKRKNSDIKNVKKIFSYYTADYEALFQKIIWKDCDILDVVYLENIVKNVTHIYHAAAIISFNNADKDKMIEINSIGTANIVDLSLKHKIKRLCFVSSIATLGSSNEKAVNESCMWDWSNQSGYAISKYLAEMEVWRGFAEGLSGIIVNPSLILGPGSWESGIGTIIQKASLGIPFYPPGSCGVIDVRDLTQIMIQLLNSDIANERFIINSDHIEYKDLMSIVAKQLNKKSPHIKLSKTFMKMLIGLDVFINKIRGKRIELSTDAVKYTTANILLDSNKINSMIEFKYRKMEESIIECVELFKTRNHEF